ncbi:hypothetical protein GOV05_05150 [Candidatus Woesearchaeota archaeon]|nr:hypothetical protein [Candidatus Woesearchaeota archaeon]
MMKTVILDTNFLFIPFQFKIDVLQKINEAMNEPFEVYVLKKSVDELNFIIEKSRAKNKEFAKLAKQFITKNNIGFFEETKQKSLNILRNFEELGVDDALLELACEEIIIATTDKELITKIKKKPKAKVLYLRAKNHIEIK